MGVLFRSIRTSLVALLLLGTVLAYGQEDRHMIKFTIKNAGVNVKGTFGKHTVTTNMKGDDFVNASFEVQIEVDRIDTGIKGRDKHLKKAKYFDLENYPYITFTSTAIAKTNEGYTMKGNLTIKATTLPVEIPFTTEEMNGKLVFKGKFELDRRDYGVGKNHLIMGDKVKMDIYYVHPLKGS